MKIVWPEMNGLTLTAGIAYIGFSIALVVLLSTWQLIAGLIAGALLAGIGWVASESHAATQRMRRPLESLNDDLARRRGGPQDPEDGWTT